MQENALFSRRNQVYNHFKTQLCLINLLWDIYLNSEQGSEGMEFINISSFHICSYLGRDDASGGTGPAPAP